MRELRVWYVSVASFAIHWVAFHYILLYSHYAFTVLTNSKRCFIFLSKFPTLPSFQKYHNENSYTLQTNATYPFQPSNQFPIHKQYLYKNPYIDLHDTGCVQKLDRNL